MKIAVGDLNDRFFKEKAEKERSGRTATEERMALLRVLAANKLPPEVTIMHMGITANPHHDTAGIQHFFQYELYPWIADYTTLRGAIHLMRSDGCAGQMKSGRHFRFISNFHTFLWALTMRLIWTHFESCHGKDLSVTNNADRC